MASSRNELITEPLQSAVLETTDHWKNDISSKINTLFLDISSFKSSHITILNSLRDTFNSNAEQEFQNWRRGIEIRLNSLNQHKVFYEEATISSLPWFPFIIVGTIILFAILFFYFTQSVSSLSAVKRKRSFVLRRYKLTILFINKE
jgi:hypothetical protein